MTTADVGKTLGADVVVLVVDDGRSRDGIAGVGLPLLVLLHKEGIVQSISLGLEGPAVLGRQQVLEAPGAVVWRRRRLRAVFDFADTAFPLLVGDVGQLHLADVGDDVLINSGGRGVVAVVVQVRQLLGRHGRDVGDRKKGCLWVKAEGLHR